MYGVLKFNRLKAQGFLMFYYWNSDFLPIFSNIYIFFFLIYSFEWAINKFKIADLSAIAFSITSKTSAISWEIYSLIPLELTPCNVSSNFFICVNKSSYFRSYSSVNGLSDVLLSIFIFCERVRTTYWYTYKVFLTYYCRLLRANILWVIW